MTMVINNEPWFVGKDVAEVLGYRLARKALYDHVEDDDKKGVPIQNPLGGKQEMTIINESGLYALILSSKLPQAREFKRRVASEMLGYAKLLNAVAMHVDEEDKRAERIVHPLCRITENGSHQRERSLLSHPFL